MKTKNDLKILGVTAAVLLLIGAAADLQISHFLYNPGSMFGKLFEAIGEFPASYLASLCAMIIAFSKTYRSGNACPAPYSPFCSL
jgi:hypothetical protein